MTLKKQVDDLLFNDSVDDNFSELTEDEVSNIGKRILNDWQAGNGSITLTSRQAAILLGNHMEQEGYE